MKRMPRVTHSAMAIRPLRLVPLWPWLSTHPPDTNAVTRTPPSKSLSFDLGPSHAGKQRSVTIRNFPPIRLSSAMRLANCGYFSTDPRKGKLFAVCAAL